MKFVVIRSNIREAITAVQRATNENVNLPILKNILIIATDQGITVTATNLEIAITAFISGKVIESGSITIPAQLLSNLLNNLQSDRLNFESKDGNVEIKTDNYSANLQGLLADDFPITPKVQDIKHYFEIKGVFLKEAIQQTTIAAQFSDIRPELNTILLDFSLENIKFTATDGFRLAEKTMGASLFVSHFTDPFHVLVPLRTSQEVLRVINNEDIVRIYRDENQILFKTDRVELISRLNEGAFPDYSPLIPVKFVTEIIVDRNELSNAVKLASVFSQKNNELRIVVHANKKAVEVASADQAVGENSYILPAKIKGEAVDVSFNVKYLADALKSIVGDEVFLGLQEETNPALIKSSSDSSYFYILKPILKA